jgi:phage-related protein
MNNVSNTITGVFENIRNAWTGLRLLFSGVFVDVSAVQSLVVE